ncbi:MAG TPA: efflux RND transporter periplasmic adaptor subunit [Candidatus Sulfopaludibacter sp.]|nr:efflux RND transporter periplasmic adaptor subunit [Candidatus Sulfopaludibacter sp.]
MTDNHRNRRGAWVIVLALAIVVIVAAIWYFRHGQDAQPEYQTVPVTRGELTQLVTATGTLNPVTNVQVGCQISGTIQKLYADFNSAVKTGEVIAEIDPRIYEAQVEQAAADLASAKANLELQQVETARNAELFTNKLISGSDYDTAVATLHEAQATVQIKQAALDNAQANLGYCKIYSPVDGIVISRNVDVGQTVAASFNTPTLFQIANDLTKMQIDTAVAEADIGGVEEKQRVDFTVDAYPYRTFRGTITQVRNAPTNSNNVVTYDCVIGVNNADYKLKPGMTANVSIIVAQRENALQIPNAALRFRAPETALAQNAAPGAGGTNGVAVQPDQGVGSSTNRMRGGGGGPGGFHGAGGTAGRGMFRTVFVLEGEGKEAKLKPVQIKIGISDGINTEVLSGLKEGDPVVTGMSLSGAQAGATANPFGGGFPRFR